MHRPATPADLSAVAACIADEQADPARHVVYLGSEADGIAAELSEDVDHDWTNHAIVEVVEGQICGVIVGEIDTELGRVWWMGPWLTGAWEARADDIYAAARRTLPDGIVQEELAADSRHVELASFAGRHGFTAQEGSAVLTLDRRLDITPEPGVRSMAPDDIEDVWRLHDEAFPGTHLTRTMLEAADERHVRLVLAQDGEIAGYVVIEVQADNSGYIDYLAVAPRFQRRGFGRALIRAGIHELQSLGATGANLTVREHNRAARSLYQSLGFTEERVAVPYRLGFTLD